MTLFATYQFTSEIKIHKSLKHRHVVQFEHFFEDSENSYILLELCRNQVVLLLPVSDDRLFQHLKCLMLALFCMS